MWSIDVISRVSPPPGESLQERSSKVSLEWHPTKNHPHLPSTVHSGSPRKAWWRCCEGHEWFASIRDSVRKSSGCPFCVGKVV